jgi:hypothetical protein
MKKSIVTISIMFSILIFEVLASDKSEGIRSDVRKMGGSCSYSSYIGTATITRIEKTEASSKQAKTKGGPGYEGYEVWFSFKADQEIKEGWARNRTEKEYLFLLANSWYPGPRYMEKYKIKRGNTYKCTLKVIAKGTCTPTIFNFLEPKRDDYFETK